MTRASGLTPESIVVSPGASTSPCCQVQMRLDRRQSLIVPSLKANDPGASHPGLTHSYWRTGTDGPGPECAWGNDSIRLTANRAHERV